VLSLSGVLESVGKREEIFPVTPKLNLKKKVSFTSVSMSGNLETVADQDVTFPTTQKSNFRRSVCFPELELLSLETQAKQEEVPSMSPVRRTIECLGIGAPTRKQQFINIENHKPFPRSTVPLLSDA